MNQIETIDKIQKVIGIAKRARKSIGFIPTMGALHQGHLSLVKQSLLYNDITVVSIFINPTQFGPNEDYAQYPRTIDKDLFLLSQLNHVDYVFTPKPDSFYMEDPLKSTRIHIPKTSTYYCGQSRPHFFDGVCSIVLRLFNCILPTNAYFGEKDFQQLFLIQKMVHDLFLPIKIIKCPIVRDENGLAMSSRNLYLRSSQKKEASYIYKMLKYGQELYQAGNTDVSDVKAKMHQFLEKNTAIKLEYIVFVDESNLELVNVCTETTRVLVAAKVENTRLIDNVSLRNELN